MCFVWISEQTAIISLSSLVILYSDDYIFGDLNIVRFIFLVLMFDVSIIFLIISPNVIRGHVVVQLVEALRYKSEGRGFDSRWCHWNFSLT
jgi:NADH:ubiquinone oxidoreductase subunit 5 (subunit L)/multisubunit Na+/H+ antiporter MnhA subunit